MESTVYHRTTSGEEASACKPLTEIRWIGANRGQRKNQVVSFLFFSPFEQVVGRIIAMKQVTPSRGRNLWWTRHPHVHLAAAAQPIFDPRGIEHRRPEDERGEML
ncbi:hypothetical protein TNCV_3704971 [Trichonephila clavipes]|nr:hypothetical protein TNCV_3704971 [Trichonephila clavipes]